MMTNSNPLSAYEPREIEWLWKDRIPFGCVTLLEGDGGVGKSYITVALGSALSRGIALPDDLPKAPIGILLLAAEDDPSVVLRPRFEKSGANLDLIRCYDQTLLLNKENLKKLESEILQHSIKLVVIDPIVSFLGQMIDTSKASDVRSIMSPLHEIANRTNCAIVVVRHWNKSTTASASQRGSGSVDFRNAARSVLQVIKVNGEHFLTLEKSNYGATGKTLKFGLNDGAPQWLGFSDLTADQLLRQQAQHTEECASELDEAKEFLNEELRDGPIYSKDLEAAARDRGLSPATLRRAKKALQINSFKERGNQKWMCELPASKINRSHHAQGAQNYLGPQVEQDEQVEFDIIEKTL